MALFAGWFAWLFWSGISCRNIYTVKILFAALFAQHGDFFFFLHGIFPWCSAWHFFCTSCFAQHFLHCVFPIVICAIFFVCLVCCCCFVFCTAFLVSHPLDTIFPRGVSPDIPHGQSPQATLTACPFPRTGGRRWRAEPGARGIPTARQCWCARKPSGAKCCAREPTGTAGERDSPTSSPATPVSARGGKLRHRDTRYRECLGEKRGLTGSRSDGGRGEQRGEELGHPA